MPIFAGTQMNNDNKQIKKIALVGVFILITFVIFFKSQGLKIGVNF